MTLTSDGIPFYILDEVSNEIWQLTERFKFPQGSLSLRTWRKELTARPAESPQSRLFHMQFDVQPTACSGGHTGPLVRQPLCDKGQWFQETHVIPESSLMFQNWYIGTTRNGSLLQSLTPNGICGKKLLIWYRLGLSSSLVSQSNNINDSEVHGSGGTRHRPDLH